MLHEVQRSKRASGALAEQRAKDYLTAQGLVWILSNYACPMGEIDLIMRDKTCLVFVEVRSKRSMAFGGALASITQTKQQRLIKTASHFQVRHAQFVRMPSRFDIVAIQGEAGQIQWIKNAIMVNHH